MDVDPMLWRVLGPEDMGTPAKQIGLRVIGAFSNGGVPLAHQETELAADGRDIDAFATSCVTLLENEAAKFLRKRPTLLDFLAVIEDAERETNGDVPRYSLLTALTAIRAGELDVAARVIDGALARGERQFSTAKGTVWELLDRDRRSGTGVFDSLR